MLTGEFLKDAVVPCVVAVGLALGWAYLWFTLHDGGDDDDY